ncbi:MAG: V-type ATPase subunit [Oscillospiraceae bacterium]|nr:V-type ATPase subunit [Oscillospiraceae bacterium]
MFRPVTGYGCVATKVKAMYGKRLSGEEWDRIKNSESAADVTAVLKNSLGWKHAGDMLPEGCDNTKQLISAIRVCIRTDRETLYKYASEADRRYVDFCVKEDEYKHILGSLRRLISGSDAGLRRPPDMTLRKSRINFPALENAKNRSELINAVSGSMYHDILSAAPVTAGSDLPDYAAVSALLENAYRSAHYKYLTRKYKGTAKHLLTERVRIEADMVNILILIRILRYFPKSITAADEILIPLGRFLSKKLIAEISAAASEQEAVDILKTTRWRSVFDDYHPADLDRLFDGAINALNKKLLRSSEPNFAAVAAYIGLKEADGERLIRAITALGYGLRPNI